MLVNGALLVASGLERIGGTNLVQTPNGPTQPQRLTPPPWSAIIS